MALSSDEKQFGGFDRIDVNGKFFTTPLEWNGRKNFLQVRLSSTLRLISLLIFTLPFPNQVYIPLRTCLVLAK